MFIDLEESYEMKNWHVPNIKIISVVNNIVNTVDSLFLLKNLAAKDNDFLKLIVFSSSFIFLCLQSTLFTCGTKCDPKVAYEFLRKVFNSKKASFTELKRGIIDRETLKLAEQPFEVAEQYQS